MAIAVRPPTWPAAARSLCTTSDVPVAPAKFVDNTNGPFNIGPTASLKKVLVRESIDKFSELIASIEAAVVTNGVVLPYQEGTLGLAPLRAMGFDHQNDASIDDSEDEFNEEEGELDSVVVM
jgi:hypothetical protein